MVLWLCGIPLSSSPIPSASDLAYFLCFYSIFLYICSAFTRHLVNPDLQGGKLSISCRLPCPAPSALGTVSPRRCSCNCRLSSIHVCCCRSVHETPPRASFLPRQFNEQARSLARSRIVMSRSNASNSGGSRKISFNVSEQYDIQDVVGEGAYGVVWYVAVAALVLTTSFVLTSIVHYTALPFISLLAKRSPSRRSHRSTIPCSACEPCAK